MIQGKIKFTKMHGAGNDYIYVNTFLQDIPDPRQAAIRWSARHTGIGSDGLVLIGRPSSADADFSMRIFNADGSEAMMCGNASRCVGKYVRERGMTDRDTVRLETLSGIRTLELAMDGPEVVSVRVDMLEPGFRDPSQFDPEAAGGSLVALDREFAGTFVSMGNPHFVTFLDDVEGFDVARYGSVLERHAAFPTRCNIEFAQVTPRGIRMRVWERGSGITMACGTGACATAVAAARTGRAPRSSRVAMDGGTLDVSWDEGDGHVYMAGPAAFVFDGEIGL